MYWRIRNLNRSSLERAMRIIRATGAKPYPDGFHLYAPAEQVNKLINDPTIPKIVSDEPPMTSSRDIIISKTLHPKEPAQLYAEGGDRSLITQELLSKVYGEEQEDIDENRTGN